MNKNVAKDNKGFSLVELIIVIAIMAILVGVIALQVIPYMEKSRVGKDQQTVDSVYNAFNNSLADESVAGDITLTISNSTATWEGITEADSKIDDSMYSALGATDGASLSNATEQKLVSALGKDKDIVCKYIYSTKEVTVYIDNTNDAGEVIRSSNKGTPEQGPSGATDATN